MHQMYKAEYSILPAFNAPCASAASALICSFPWCSITPIVQPINIKDAETVTFSQWNNHFMMHKIETKSPFYFNNGKAITSRMLEWSVSSMTSLSNPIPIPPVGGIPYSKAVMKSSSTMTCIHDSTAEATP